MGMRVLIVDDSALMRRWLQECFASAPGIESQTARDGKDALAKLDSFNPDVVTLDINMPEMDGLTCLAQIMATAPRPVVMLSSLTDAGALATFEAMELGAVDYIPKPSGTVSHDLKLIFPQILSKVRAAARIRVGASAMTTHSRDLLQQARGIAAKPLPEAELDLPAGTGRCDLVLIGSSTGGPKALEEVLFRLGPDFPVPILIAQHMPRRFTRVFAERLSNQGSLPVIEVTGSTELLPGAAYLAQGDADVQVSMRRSRLVASSVPANLDLVWNPSVNRMVDSALSVLPATRLVSVLLTGMGDDGAAAMTRLRQGGGRTIAQSEASSAIFGMPRALIEAGGAERVVDIDRIAATLLRFVGA
jgi:two-component system chemotaxis response regulator CheB